MTNTDMTGGEALQLVKGMQEKVSDLEGLVFAETNAKQVALDRVAALEAEKARGFVSDALRQIAGWMDTGGPTYHEAEMIGMAVSGPTECSSHKQCTKAAKKAFLEAARIWDHMHPSATPGPAPAERNQCDGCQAGIPIDNGMHRMGKPGGYPDLMACTAGSYGTAPAAPDVAGLLRALEIIASGKLAGRYKIEQMRAQAKAALATFHREG